MCTSDFSHGEAEKIKLNEQVHHGTKILGFYDYRKGEKEKRRKDEKKESRDGGEM